MRQRPARFVTRLALLLSLVGLPACGGGSIDPGDATDLGYKALGVNDFASAKLQFDAALKEIGEDTTHEHYVRAKLGAITAACKTDPERAETDLLALAKAMPEAVTERTYADIAGRLGSAGNFTQAIALLEAGKQRFPGSASLDGIGKKLVKEAEKAGDSGALDALAGLGYAGD